MQSHFLIDYRLKRVDLLLPRLLMREILGVVGHQMVEILIVFRAHAGNQLLHVYIVLYRQPLL